MSMESKKWNENKMKKKKTGAYVISFFCTPILLCCRFVCATRRIMIICIHSLPLHDWRSQFMSISFEMNEKWSTKCNTNKQNKQTKKAATHRKKRRTKNQQWIDEIFSGKYFTSVCLLVKMFGMSGFISRLSHHETHVLANLVVCRKLITKRIKQNC